MQQTGKGFTTTEATQMIPGLTVREDGVLCWNGVAIEFRNTVWDGMVVGWVAARLGPHGPAWVVDHGGPGRAAQIRNLSAHRLESMWALPAKDTPDESADPPRH